MQQHGLKHVCTDTNTAYAASGWLATDTETISPTASAHRPQPKHSQLSPAAWSRYELVPEGVEIHQYAIAYRTSSSLALRRRCSHDRYRSGKASLPGSVATCASVGNAEDRGSENRRVQSTERRLSKTAARGRMHHVELRRPGRKNTVFRHSRTIEFASQNDPPQSGSFIFFSIE